MNIIDYIKRNLELIKEIQRLYIIIKNTDKKVYNLEKEITQLNAENSRLKRKNDDLSKLILSKDEEVQTYKCFIVEELNKNYLTINIRA